MQKASAQRLLWQSVNARSQTEDQQVADLNELVIGIQQNLDGWIEKWVAVEYNARMLGINPDEIFGPLPDPRR